MTPTELLDNRKRIGVALRKKRERLEMSREKIATISGLGWYTIGRIEDGKKDYRFDSLVIYATAIRNALKEKRKSPTK